MNIGVIGAYGSVGIPLCNKLADAGHNVSAMDKETQPPSLLSLKVNCGHGDGSFCVWEKEGEEALDYVVVLINKNCVDLDHESYTERLIPAVLSLLNLTGNQIVKKKMIFVTDFNADKPKAEWTEWDLTMKYIEDMLQRGMGQNKYTVIRSPETFSPLRSEGLVKDLQNGGRPCYKTIKRSFIHAADLADVIIDHFESDRNVVNVVVPDQHISDLEVAKMFGIKNPAPLDTRIEWPKHRRCTHKVEPGENRDLRTYLKT